MFEVLIDNEKVKRASNKLACEKVSDKVITYTDVQEIFHQKLLARQTIS